MALIGKIRKNSWVLIVLIGLGLGGFVIMDMFSGQQSIFGSQQTVMANIEGQKVDIREFNNAESILYQNQGSNVYGNRSVLWNYFVEEAIIGKEAEALGLGVSDKELLDLEFGPDSKLSPIVASRYSNPNNPSLVDRDQLTQIKSIIEGGSAQMREMIQTRQLNPNFPYFWQYQEKEIKKTRLQSKLIKMVEKSLYTPTWVAEMVGNDQSQKIDFAFVQIPFDEIADEEVALSNEDYQRYLDENKTQFMNEEETRKVEFVVFDVIPSDKDSANLRQQLAGLIPGFEETEDDSVFVANNFGTISMQWLEKSALAEAIADTAFQIPAGSVFGPYEDGGTYKAVKVLDKVTMPDSARSRHILISATTPEEFATAEKRIDSLKNLILAGTHQFDSLAMQFSQDPGSASKGGEYDYVPVNQFVPEFNDVIFYTGNIGDLYSVRTQFGIHLIEPLGRTGERKERIRLAYITQNIEPSEETQEAVQDDAIEFADANRTIDDLIKAVTEREDLEFETSSALARNDFSIGSLGSGNTSRDIVRWAFGNDPNMPAAEVGGVAPEPYGFQDPAQYYINKFVVVGLKSIQKAGMPDIESIKEDIELQVINMKKGEMITEQIGANTDLASIAQQFNVEVDTAKNVSFSAGFIPDIGSEPKAVANAFNADLNTASEPVVGNSGVFVLMPIYKPTATPTTNIPTIRQTNQTSSRSQVSARLMQALRKRADIEDNRARFF